MQIIETLRRVFEAPKNQRLLLSFAHRLGLMHDHPVAKEIVETWLQPGGLLERISDLSEVGSRLLDYVSPVAPGALLNKIETELTAPSFKSMEILQGIRKDVALLRGPKLRHHPRPEQRPVHLGPPSCRQRTRH